MKVVMITPTDGGNVVSLRAFKLDNDVICVGVKVERGGHLEIISMELTPSDVSWFCENLIQLVKE